METRSGSSGLSKIAVTRPESKESINQRGDASMSGAISRADRLAVVVGFDGSPSAYRALDASALLISGRLGSIEVVFVAHVAPVASLLTDTVSDTLAAFDSAEIEFVDDVRTRLGDIESRWHFQRRDGLIVHELVAVADELSSELGEGSRVVIVVGSQAHSLRHVAGSVPVALVKNAKYPVLVVP